MAETAAGRSLPFARIALIVAALVAVIAVGIAVWRGRGEAEAPVSASGPPGTPPGDINAMVQQLEERLKANPKDAPGWRMLGIAYYETGRYGESARAYQTYTALEPKDAAGFSALGEALVLSGTGGVTPPAAAAFRQALGLDQKDPRARYFLAVQKDLAGDHRGAVEDWIALLKDTPAGAPWEQSVREVTQKVATDHRIDIAGRLPAPSPAAAMSPNNSTADVASAAIPGPTPEQMAAASSLPPSQQDQMVQGMVASLAGKLKANPKQPDGWIRMMRARMVLNDPAAAKAALAEAKAANPGDAAELDAAAKTLGVPGA